MATNHTPRIGLARTSPPSSPPSSAESVITNLESDVIAVCNINESLRKTCDGYKEALVYAALKIQLLEDQAKLAAEDHKDEIDELNKKLRTLRNKRRRANNAVPLRTIRR